jgi:hypothetical protein
LRDHGESRQGGAPRNNGNAGKQPDTFSRQTRGEPCDRTHQNACKRAKRHYALKVLHVTRAIQRVNVHCEERKPEHQRDQRGSYGARDACTQEDALCDSPDHAAVRCWWNYHGASKSMIVLTMKVMAMTTNRTVVVQKTKRNVSMGLRQLRYEISVAR